MMSRVWFDIALLYSVMMLRENSNGLFVIIVRFRTTMSMFFFSKYLVGESPRLRQERRLRSKLECLGFFFGSDATWRMGGEEGLE